MVDLDKLERLHADAAGTPYKAKGDWIYAQSVSHKRTFSRRPMAYTIDNRDRRYKPTETAAYIVAACNAVPDLIDENRALQKLVWELERQRDWLARKCEELSDDPEDFFMPYNTPAKEWIKRAKQATKEDVE